LVAISETRLTALAHGGGCGCKLSPGVLRELLADMPATQGFADLLVASKLVTMLRSIALTTSRR
jgi:selenide,water dikinase